MTFLVCSTTHSLIDPVGGDVDREQDNRPDGRESGHWARGATLRYCGFDGEQQDRPFAARACVVQWGAITVAFTGVLIHSAMQWARQLLARPGNRIIAGVRQPDKAADLKALGGSRVQILPLDVSSSTSIESWADEIKASTAHVDVGGMEGRFLIWGPGSIHHDSRREIQPPSRPEVLLPLMLAPSGLAGMHQVVINNAGVYGERQDLGSVTSENMVSTFVANTVGPLLIVQALASRGLLGGSAGPTLVATVSSKVERVWCL